MKRDSLFVGFCILGLVVGMLLVTWALDRRLDRIEDKVGLETP